MTRFAARYLRLTLLVLAAFFAAPASKVTAGGAFDGTDDSFANSMPVADSELGKVRGKFLSVGGLEFNFAITTRTLVDGALANTFTLDTADLEKLSAISDIHDLQQIVQVGTNNNAAALDALQSNAGVITVLQNSLDDLVIQNFTQLDLAISNLRSFQNQVLTGNIEDSQINALR